jgi:phospholipid transport system substrate-binding protein
MSARNQIVGISVLVFSLFCSGAFAEPNDPSDVVKETANDVLTILQKDKDISNGDIKKLGQVIEEKIAPKFDFQRISQSVLGKRWNSASASEQDRFISEFRSLLIHTYSSALSKYKNQTIEYMPVHSEPSDKEVKVKTQVLQPGSQAIPLDYSMEKVNGKWMVYDLSIDGLSLITIYRGQFAEEVKNNGISGVINRLAEKNKT